MGISLALANGLLAFATALEKIFSLYFIGQEIHAHRGKGYITSSLAD